MARESQGNPCCQHSLMMMMMLIIYHSFQTLIFLLLYTRDSYDIKQHFVTNSLRIIDYNIHVTFLAACLSLYDYNLDKYQPNNLPHFIIIILLCHQHGYPRSSLATPPNRSSVPAGPQGYTPYPHRADVCRFELVTLFCSAMWRGP